MTRLNATLATAAMLTAFFSIPQVSNAQIIGEVEANIPHSFTIANTTFPAGKYYFRMSPNSDLEVMTVRSADDKISGEFLVRESRCSHTPSHSEVVFNRYGDSEVLSKVYESGERLGVAVEEPSRIEARLQKQGLHPVEHAQGPTP